ncbi:MAG: hypothetical protein DRI37_04635, partial [Chloroflexi bacterium]
SLFCEEEMNGSPVDIVVFAPLAPILCVILFWFIQLLFIESQRYLLDKIRPKHKPLMKLHNLFSQDQSIPVYYRYNYHDNYNNGPYPYWYL